MERWSNKIAVVTGASSGIGAAICLELVKANVIVVGLARRVEKIEELRRSTGLPANLQKRFHCRKCDVSNEADVTNVFEWIIKNLGGIDILVNNAGILRPGYLISMEAQVAREIFDTNVMGIVYCTRKAFNSMNDRNVYGHIINVNSITGHKIINTIDQNMSLNMYTPSKYAVTAMTEIYRQECTGLNKKIKITSISPGLVATEILPPEFEQITAILQSEDVANAVLYCISTPPNVQISELTIRPVGEKL